jgi:hypothetical protein
MFSVSIIEQRKIGLFHTKYISVTNAMKGYSRFNSSFTICFGHTWPSSGVYRYAKLLYCILSLFPVAPTLEHRESAKRFVSLQFLNPKTVGRTPWTGDQPVARLLPIQTQNKHTQTSMPRVGLEPTIPPFERVKTVHALDRAATVIVLYCTAWHNFMWLVIGTN